MPDGLSEEGIRKAAYEYYAYLSFYPYQMYINWVASDDGNILYNDKKFVTRLYTWNEDVFSERGCTNYPLKRRNRVAKCAI